MAPLPQENLNALQKAIDAMEEKGAQEDPRYSQLLAMRARQSNQEISRPTMQVKYSLFYFQKNLEGN